MEGKYMARPLEQGLLYFPLDVDIFQNKKIRIVMAEYGTDGYAIYMYLLCEIYKNGYYVIADNDFVRLMADDLRMNVNKIRQVINFLLGRSLFDNKLFQSDKVLTSISVQRRYQLALQKRINDNTVDIKDFWLLKKQETETLVQVRPFLENSQEKATKESKEKESKINQTIVERNAGTGAYTGARKTEKSSKVLTTPQREQLNKEFGKELVDEYVVKTTAYHCCQYEVIRRWILEDKDKKNMRSKPVSKNRFNNFPQREVTQEELDKLEQMLLKKNY